MEAALVIESAYINLLTRSDATGVIVSWANTDINII